MGYFDFLCRPNGQKPITLAFEFAAARLVKTGGGLVKHARYYWLLLAEGQLTRERFGSVLRMIAGLPLPNG